MQAPDPSGPDTIGGPPSPNRPDGAMADMRDIMEVVGLELVDLGQVGTALQATLSPTRTHDYEDLQTLDLLTQRLFCLADFLSTLAPSIDAGCRADIEPALATICLSDMVRRLSTPIDDASFSGAATDFVSVDTGELDLF